MLVSLLRHFHEGMGCMTAEGLREMKRREVAEAEIS